MDTWVLLWTQLILGLDLTYTAFLVPILVGFEVSDVDWGWGTHLLCLIHCVQCSCSIGNTNTDF